VLDVRHRAANARRTASARTRHALRSAAASEILAAGAAPEAPRRATTAATPRGAAGRGAAGQAGAIAGTDEVVRRQVRRLRLAARWRTPLLARVVLHTAGMTESKDKDPNQGEGDRRSARRYDRHASEF